MAGIAEEQLVSLLNNESGSVSEPSANQPATSNSCATIDEVIRAADLQPANMDENDKSSNLEWVSQSKEWCALVVGRTGTGKSTVLNGIVGEELFKVGHAIDEHGTKSIECGTKIFNVGIAPNITQLKLKVVDTPGFHESKVHNTTSKEIICEIKKECEKPDLLMYCIDMRQARYYQHECTIKKITSDLGVGIWDHSIVVLTFANVVAESRCPDESEFRKVIKDNEKKIKEILKCNKVPKESLSKIKFAPAGISSTPHLPGIDYWFSDLWTCIIEASSDASSPALIKIWSSRVVSEEDHDKLSQNWDKSLCSQDLITRKDKSGLKWTKMEKVGVTAGMTGAGVGAGVVGASIGGTIGALAIGIPSFGVAAGAGLIIGGVVGGAIGMGTAGAVGGSVAAFKKHKAGRESQEAKEEPQDN